jgi:hypothetical protein
MSGHNVFFANDNTLTIINHPITTINPYPSKWDPTGNCTGTIEGKFILWQAVVLSYARTLTLSRL